MCFAYNDAGLIAISSVVVWLIAVIAWVAGLRSTKRLDPFVIKWLQNIRWVPEAISREEEFHLSIGRTTRIEAS